MPTHAVDVAILGAGTAGMAAYRAAAARTDRVLLIEAERYGTTCARVGCMPSKLLIAAADAAHAVENAHGFGVHPTGLRIDGREVMDRVKRERDRFVGFVVDAAQRFPERHRLMGRARFLDAGRLAVGDAVVEARAIVIATGSRPRVLPFLADLGDRLVVNDDVFDWDELPRSVAVFGPGVIGLEIGQALARLGVRVRIFGVGGFVGPLTDPEMKAEAARVVDAEVPLHPDVHGLRVERRADRVYVRWDGGEETFDYALAATGRVPNVDGMGLETTGLALDPRGVPLYDARTLQAGASAIFVAGDANGDLPLLHEAADEGKIAGQNAATFPAVTPGLRRSPLSVVFTDPNIAMVGQSWAQLQGRDVVTGRVSFDDQGRARVLRMNRGHLHVYADRASGRFLGAEMIAPRAEHLAHSLAWAHQVGLTVPQMLDLPFYHPVVEEGVRTALRDAAAQL